ncbi:hypothetical protein EMPS_01075 [Entomortierella parvispora]|uniref:F-box domain-containing protein n=1 Tax=Entomortierella parvispora TaxID=205924 RepID=A0A9P3H261_9FUNG|nr:hypothetical protein EMPS_01075 [Entomortierella parvispora]
MVRTSSRLAAVAEKAQAQALAEEQARAALAEVAATFRAQQAAKARISSAKKKRIQPKVQHSTSDGTADGADMDTSETNAGTKTSKSKRDATTMGPKKSAASKQVPVLKAKDSSDLKSRKKVLKKKQGVDPEHHPVPTTSLTSDNPSTTATPTTPTKKAKTPAKASTKKAKSTSTASTSFKKTKAPTATVIESVAEKPRVGGKKRKVKKEDEDGDEHKALDPESRPTKRTKRQHGETKQDAVSVMEIRAAAPKGTNPCAWVPTEVWHVILSYLPLSQVAVISLVNTTWLDGCRSYPAWKTICEKNNLGPPKSKYKTFMALACKYSYFICDRCHDLTMKGLTKSEVTLPIKDKDDDDLTWLLCRNCRLAYYGRHPLKLRAKKDPNDGYVNRITRTRALDQYELTTDDLDTLPCTVHQNPHYRNGPPMRLYNEVKVEKLALRVHGGHCGISAAASDLIRKKREAFKLRDSNFNKPRPLPSSQELASQEQASLGQASQEQASQGQASQELASQGQASQELASQGQASQEQAWEEQTSQGQTSQGQASQGQASQEQTLQEQTSQDRSSQEKSSQEQSSQEQSSHQQYSQDQTSQDQTSQDQTSQDQTSQEQEEPLKMEE